MYVLNRTRNIDNFEQLLVFSMKVVNCKHYKTYRLVSFDCKVKYNNNHIDQQECIPVGCVPPASVATSQYWGGVPSGGACTSRGCTLWGCTFQGGVPSKGCTFRGLYQAYPPPLGMDLDQAYPPKGPGTRHTQSPCEQNDKHM